MEQQMFFSTHTEYEVWLTENKDKITLSTNKFNKISLSGKSNIVDAVRWVLGEQSVKSLRGDSNMTDVIFSGSKSRRAMNSASVTLIFDNSDNRCFACRQNSFGTKIA